MFLLNAEGLTKLETEGDQSHMWCELLQETSPEGIHRLGGHGNIKDYCLSLRPKAHMPGVVRAGIGKIEDLEADSERLEVFY